jgi:hypothetical protein
MELFFCYLYINRFYQLIISSGLLVVDVVLLVYSQLQYGRSKKAGYINSLIKWIYITIFIWAIRINPIK